MTLTDSRRMPEAPSATVRVKPSGMRIVGSMPANGGQRATLRDTEEWS